LFDDLFNSYSYVKESFDTNNLDSVRTGIQKPLK
jgi:hypothetical protein